MAQLYTHLEQGAKEKRMLLYTARQYEWLEQQLKNLPVGSTVKAKALVRRYNAASPTTMPYHTRSAKWVNQVMGLLETVVGKQWRKVAGGHYEKVVNTIDCAICLEAHPARSTVHPCTHSFCEECVDAMQANALGVGRRLECPLCRAPVEHVHHPRRTVEGRQSLQGLGALAIQ